MDNKQGITNITSSSSHSVTTNNCELVQNDAKQITDQIKDFSAQSTESSCLKFRRQHSSLKISSNRHLDNKYTSWNLLKERVNYLMKLDNYGIQLNIFPEMFYDLYKINISILLEEFYNYSNYVDYLFDLDDLIRFEFHETYTSIHSINNDNLRTSTNHKACDRVWTFGQVLENIKLIINKNYGCLFLENLAKQYKYYIGHDIPLKVLGCKTVHELIKEMRNYLELSTISNRYVLHNKITRDNITTKYKTISAKVIRKLRFLLHYKYPFLKVNEIQGAYHGLLGGDPDDLNPTKYGYTTLQDLLEAYPSIAILRSWGQITYICSSFQNLSPPIHFNYTFPPLEVVDNCNRFDHDFCSEMPLGERLDVRVCKAHSPQDLWIMRRTKHDNPTALDKLDKQMYSFYNSPIGDRYKLTSVEKNIPVAVFRYSDGRYYRGYVTSILPCFVVEALLVDHGTICLVDWTTGLRHLHKQFMKLPARVIHAKLEYIKSHLFHNNCRKYLSKHFKRNIENRKLTAHIREYSGQTVIIDLWDTIYKANV